MLLSGVCWSLVYIQIIRQGFKYKTYGMPLLALALNFTWEFTYGFIFPSAHNAQHIVNIVWFVLDAFIVFTFFRFGVQFFPKHFSKAQFISWSVLIFVTSLLLQLLFHDQFGAHAEGFFAFLQNILMSYLFITMLFKRPTTEGQSLSVAILKCLGTLAATLGVLIKVWSIGSFELPNWDRFFVLLGVLCFVFDVLYIIFLARRLKQERLNS